MCGSENWHLLSLITTLYAFSKLIVSIIESQMHLAFQLKVFFFLLIVENTHGIKFIIITILDVQLRSAKYMYIVVQPISRTFLFSKTETRTTIFPS